MSLLADYKATKKWQEEFAGKEVTVYKNVMKLASLNNYITPLMGMRVEIGKQLNPDSIDVPEWYFDFWTVSWKAKVTKGIHCWFSVEDFVETKPFSSLFSRPILLVCKAKADDMIACDKAGHAVFKTMLPESLYEW